MERTHRLIALAIVFLGCAIITTGGIIAGAISDGIWGGAGVGGLATLICGVLFGIEFVESRMQDQDNNNKLPPADEQ